MKIDDERLLKQALFEIGVLIEVKPGPTPNAKVMAYAIIANVLSFCGHERLANCFLNCDPALVAERADEIAQALERSSLSASTYEVGE